MRRAASTLKTDVASTTRDGVSGKEVFQRRHTLEPRAPGDSFLFSRQKASRCKRATLGEIPTFQDASLPCLLVQKRGFSNQMGI